MKKTIAMLVAALSFGVAVAQTRHEVYVQYNRSSDKSDNYLGVTLGYKPAMQVTGEGQYLALEYGAELTYTTNFDDRFWLLPKNNVVMDDYDYTGRMKMLSLGVPLTLAYHKHGLSLVPYAGVDLRWNAYGMFSPKGNSTDDFSIFSESNPEYKRFAAGWRAGLDWHVSRLVVGVQVGTDFNKMNNSASKCPFTAKLKLGYTF